MPEGPIPLRPATNVLYEIPDLVPAPLHRNASPSGPWPWLNVELDPELELDINDSPPPSKAAECSHIHGDCGCWAEYPQSLFPNWTSSRVKESKIKSSSNNLGTCILHRVDVSSSGVFSDPGKYAVTNNKNFWKLLHAQPERPPDVRLRAIFLENLSVPVLQMLGTKYNIEPFFFTSSLNRIPSRYQELEHPALDRDHVTITLTFLRAGKLARNNLNRVSSRDSQMINTQASLLLNYDKSARKDTWILYLDLLAIHMVRSPDSSTIISYHPRLTPNTPANSAKHLCTLVRLAGRSVHWQKLYKSGNPTFILLTIMWDALYSWDHALSPLAEHIRALEANVMHAYSMRFTQALHKIDAYLLHYTSLLNDFRISVEFISNTSNPPIVASSPQNESTEGMSALKGECDNLLREIGRLREEVIRLEQRLKNVMQLVFSITNIEDSKHMKHISWLTMLFLPSTFAATIFGMNVRELAANTYGSVLHYTLAAFPLTLFTIWILIAVQWPQDTQTDSNSIWARLFWPKRLLEQCIAEIRRTLMTRT